KTLTTFQRVQALIAPLKNSTAPPWHVPVNACAANGKKPTPTSPPTSRTYRPRQRYVAPDTAYSRHRGRRTSTGRQHFSHGRFCSRIPIGAASPRQNA